MEESATNAFLSSRSGSNNDALNSPTIPNKKIVDKVAGDQAGASTTPGNDPAVQELCGPLPLDVDRATPVGLRAAEFHPPWLSSGLLFSGNDKMVPLQSWVIRDSLSQAWS